MNINELCEYFAKAGCSEKRRITREIDSDDEKYFGQIDGVLSADSLDLLLNSKVAHKQNYAFAAEALIYKGGENSVSFKSFKKIMSLGKKYKKRFVYSMAHIKLPFYQLAEINKTNYAFEPFENLIFVICGNDCFSVSDVEKLLSESKQCYEVVSGAINRYMKENGVNEKAAFADDYLNTHTDKYPKARRI